MPSLPPARACLFAEQVRPELGEKSTIIGFAGIAPHVIIDIESYPMQINFCAFLLCEEAKSDVPFQLEVETEGPLGNILPRTKVEIPKVKAGKTVSCAFNFGAFPIAALGTYKVRVYSEGFVHSEHSFKVRLATKESTDLQN